MRFETIGYGSTTLCGFIRFSGSQIRLKSANAPTSSGPNIFSSISARDWPSPCSPESDPPSDTTRSAASSRKPRHLRRPPAERRSKSMRQWMQPSPKCPYIAVR